MLPGFGRLGLPVFGAFRVRVLTLQGLGGLGFRQFTILGFRVFRIKLRRLGWLLFRALGFKRRAHPANVARGHLHPLQDLTWSLQLTPDPYF